MRILFHVFTLLGTGHLQRARAIAEALSPHEVSWLGHHPPGAPGTLIAQPLVVTADPSSSAEEAAAIQAGRRLAEQIRQEPPDILLTEHFPFGNDALSDGFLPVLQAAKSAGIPIVASVRDILGKDRQHLDWAKRAVHILNYWYDAILCHGDTDFLPFDLPLVEHLKVPVLPTGYVRVGTSPAWQPHPRHWVASCGSGRGEGLHFCQAMLAAQHLLSAAGWRLTLVCGKETWAQLQALSVEIPSGTTLLAWTEDLPGLLATATVSVSQSGYNTCLEVMASGAPGVFIPYVEPRNNEQRLRAEAIAHAPGYQVIPPYDRHLPERVAEAVSTLEHVVARPPSVRLGGAKTSAELLLTIRK